MKVRWVNVCSPFFPFPPSPFCCTSLPLYHITLTFTPTGVHSPHHHHSSFHFVAYTKTMHTTWKHFKETHTQERCSVHTPNDCVVYTFHHCIVYTLPDHVVYTLPDCAVNTFHNCVVYTLLDRVVYTVHHCVVYTLPDC